MEKIFKKCVFGSTLAHIGLIAIVVLFAGFTRKSDDFESFKPITIMNLDNVIVTDGPTRGGGSGSLPPVITPPAPKPIQQQPQPPQPQTQPQSRQKSEEQKTEESPIPKPEPAPKNKNTSTSDDSHEETSLDGKLPSRNRSTGIKISTNLVVRKNGSTSGKGAKNTTTASAATGKLAQEFNSAIKNIGAGLSSGGLHMNDVPGFGGGGPAMVNYTQLIMSIFDRAWIPPTEITDENMVAEVRIIIHRSGKVTSARIIKRSGNAAMDASVMRALESVTSVPAFPAEARDFERTFVIEFNLKAKLARG
ncbi:MAG: TonB family protein [Verrucomicrobiae bacterium]|nr:TonB family protein [Verrucomicrobiae bacterium]